MARIALGDRHAFRQIVERHARRAHSVALRLVFNRAEAEDRVQETCIKLWVNAAQWDRGKGKFTTWFYRMLTNSCIDYQRRKKTVALDDTMQIVDPADSAEQSLAERQMAAHVRRALEELPERQRVAMTLCCYEEMSNKEAAEIMGVHLKALEGLLVRARAALRQSLAGLAKGASV